MPKFFVMSDIHSYYDEMMVALSSAGYNSTDENNYIIVCGDLFDRGPKPLEVFNFFMNTPRCILIRGNHEDLFEDCCHREMALSHDYSNGTFDTIVQFGSIGISVKNMTPQKVFKNALEYVKPLFNKLVDYFETKKYVFVHGWIPVSDAPSIYVKDEYPRYFHENWRDMGDKAWSVARWENGMELAEHGMAEPHKLTVCGHWHTSWAHSYFDNDGPEWGPGSNFHPYWSDGVIGIDACTAYSHMVNCIVLEDEFLEGDKDEFS